MIRGLNAIYLQAPYVRQAQDIADLLFLTQSWSIWLLDHHHLKENTMLPGFEAALSVPAGILTLSSSRSASTVPLNSDEGKTRVSKGKEKEGYPEGEDAISFLLHRVYAYASATHKDLETYSSTTLQELLGALAETLVPHLTRQVGLLMSMREMCLGSSITGDDDDVTKREEGIPAPLPLPMVKLTKTTSSSSSSSSAKNISPSLPTSSSSSTFSSTPTPASSASASSPAHSPPSVSLSLFPSTTTPTRLPHHIKTNSISTTNRKSNPATKNGNTNSIDTNKSKIAKDDNRGKHTPATKTLEPIDKAAKARLAHARALLEADDRANKLTQVHAAADARAAAAMDPFVIPPMIVRLRDTTLQTATVSTSSYAASMPFSPSSSPSLSRMSSSSSLASRKNGTGMGVSMGMGMGMGIGIGGGNKGDWPRLSVPAVHAVADKLSTRYAGSWRFLPCDVWGRPRELPFLGE
ncbi:hypothetical protein F5Y03DRAFT_350775 [Xylaria venustula]|nr:hypothetical protein F5Y03DRAFT_350775 [Xylaria venustula]